MRKTDSQDGAIQNSLKTQWYSAAGFTLAFCGAKTASWMLRHFLRALGFNFFLLFCKAKWPSLSVHSKLWIQEPRCHPSLSLYDFVFTSSPVYFTIVPKCTGAAATVIKMGSLCHALMGNGYKSEFWETFQAMSKLSVSCAFHSHCRHCPVYRLSALRLWLNHSSEREQEMFVNGEKKSMGPVRTGIRFCHHKHEVRSCFGYVCWSSRFSFPLKWAVFGIYCHCVHTNITLHSKRSL